MMMQVQVHTGTKLRYGKLFLTGVQEDLKTYWYQGTWLQLPGTHSTDTRGSFSRIPVPVYTTAD